jgi:hypothetical protein
MGALNTYVAALFAHVVVVTYLLGADLGRLYLARLGAAPGVSPPARATAARGSLWLAAVNNAALVSILPAGVSLGASLGVFRIVSETWYLATWLIAGSWLALSFAADRAAAHAGAGGALPRADLGFRLLMGAGQVYDGVIALAGTNVSVEARWLGVKIFAYGLLILVSIPARHAGFAMRREAAGLAADEAGADRLARVCARVTLPVVAGWLLVLVAAWMGVAKPV